MDLDELDSFSESMMEGFWVNLSDIDLRDGRLVMRGMFADRRLRGALRAIRREPRSRVIVIEGVESWSVDAYPTAGAFVVEDLTFEGDGKYKLTSLHADGVISLRGEISGVSYLVDAGAAKQG